MKKIVIFGTSLSPNSKSQILAREVHSRCQKADVQTVLIDLRELSLPESGRPDASNHATTKKLRAEVSDATHVVFALAIYNYNVSSSAKNLLELLSVDEMQDKIVGFVCAAGGNHSYMSAMSFANSLMLDFRSWIVPRFVYAIGQDFQNGEASAEIQKRLDLFVNQLLTGPGGYRA